MGPPRSTGSHPATPSVLPSSELPTHAAGATENETEPADDGFAAFWAADPLQDGEYATRKLWRGLSAFDRATATAGAGQYAAYVTATGTTRVHRPQNFIGVRRFLDWSDGLPKGYRTNQTKPDDPPPCCAECGAALSAEELIDESAVAWTTSGWVHVRCLKVAHD